MTAALAAMGAVEAAMTRTGATVITAMVEDAPAQWEVIRCESCKQVIARRLPNGGYTLLLPGPVTVGADGRVDAHCPSCGRRMRFRAATGPRTAA